MKNNYNSSLKEKLVLSALALASSTTLYLFSPSNNISKHLENNTFELTLSEQTVDNFVQKYKLDILETSKKYNLPPELIAATLKGENCNRRKDEDLKDSFGTFIGLDTSLGVGQVNISTASELDKGKYTREEMITRLLDPKINIEYIAKFYDKHLTALGINFMDRPNLIKNPSLVHRLGRIYVGGPHSKSETANLAGLGVLSYLIDQSTFRSFDRKENEVTAIASNTKKYLCGLPEVRALRSEYSDQINIDVNYLSEDECPW